MRVNEWRYWKAVTVEGQIPSLGAEDGNGVKGMIGANQHPGCRTIWSSTLMSGGGSGKLSHHDAEMDDVPITH